jgi:hypothetical protein
MREDIRLYCGLSEKSWSGVPVSPGPYACISPISGRSQRTKRETCLSVPSGVQVIQDSGAFSDSWTERLTFGQALDRQVLHADKYGYSDKVSFRATYDLLIDEVWHEGNRFKRRWSVSDAESAIEETIQAAAWLDMHRDGKSLAISAQGVDAPQYLRCVQRLLPYLRGNDILGLGGWCIIGKMSRQMMPVFRETIDLVLPFVAAQGIKSVHIWGVIFPPALAHLLQVAKENGIFVSTDSAGVSLNPVRGQWGYGSWRDNRYQRPTRLLLGADRVRHATLTRNWLNTFGDSIDYARVTLYRPGNNVTHCGPYPVAAKCDFPTCIVCGTVIVKRSHAKTCSARCRKALSRQ